MNRREKLIAFNNTEKYNMEFDFLRSILTLRKGENVLDYGCGTGYAVFKLRQLTDANVYGYDEVDCLVERDEFLFRNSYHFPFDKVYFMHSFARTEDPIGAINAISGDGLKSGGRVYVITPNKYWVEQNKAPGYVPDPLVLKHYSLSDLEHMFTVNGFKIICSGQFGSNRLEINERLFLIAEKK